MRNFITGAVFALAALAGPAVAEDAPVVVELYTSQGCSSCPPADALLGELAARDDVIALALHVDYWDYIGWKDEFADPAHTERQRAYARAAGSNAIYTPQMIVQGRDHVVGYKPMKLAELMQAHAEAARPVALDVTIDGDRIAITARAEAELDGGVSVQVVRYLSARTVDIRRGENAGRSLTYHNIVADWVVLDEWSGRGTYRGSVRVTGDDSVAVILQQAGHGPILAAARAR